MTKDDALKLALEALEAMQNAIYNIGGEHVQDLEYAAIEQADIAEQAISAINEALEQPKQEPVAAVLEVRRPNGPWQQYNIYSSVDVAKDVMNRVESALIEVRVLFLYTTPPKREWVGLTDEEYTAIRYGCDEDDNDYVDYELFDEGEYGMEINIYVDRFAKAIEAKLKEKNT